MYLISHSYGLLQSATMNYPMRDKAAHFRRPLGPDQNTANIPIIDISAPDADQKEVAKQLVDAAEEHGFIYIRNLGLDIQAKDIDGAFDLVSKRRRYI